MNKLSDTFELKIEYQFHASDMEMKSALAKGFPKVELRYMERHDRFV